MEFTLPPDDNSDNLPGVWISTEERLPAYNTRVLVLIENEIRIAEMRLETPGWEEETTPYSWWSDPYDDDNEIPWADVSAWMPLPAVPVRKEE